ncbi:MAG: helix-turn-helix transcriptional regulator, partial [Elusimicrobiota bacterium]
NPNYLADIERGKRNPSVKSLQKIASGLKVKIYRFFN